MENGGKKGEIPTAGIRRGSEAQISLISLAPGRGRGTEMEPGGRGGNEIEPSEFAGAGAQVWSYEQ